MTAARLPRLTVSLVGARAGGYCEKCGRWLAGPLGWSHHHRRPRAMGGTSDPLAHHPSNVVLICGSGVTGCHGWLETHRTRAWETGWIIRQQTNGERTDPRDCPVWLPRIDSWMTPGPGRWFAMVERIEGYERDGIFR